MFKLNGKLILDPASALDGLMAVTAALYTGINRKTATAEEAQRISVLCQDMWQVCDALRAIAAGGTN